MRDCKVTDAVMTLEDGGTATVEHIYIVLIKIGPRDASYHELAIIYLLKG